MEFYFPQQILVYSVTFIPELAYSVTFIPEEHGETWTSHGTHLPLR